jgi:hypothetical protein
LVADEPTGAQKLKVAVIFNDNDLEAVKQLPLTTMKQDKVL